MNTTPELSCDVLIIGSGAAGLSLALRLAEKHQVIVLSKGPVSEGSTFYAQGGMRLSLLPAMPARASSG